MRGVFLAAASAAMLVLPLPSTALAAQAPHVAGGAGPIVNARADEPVILTGAQIPTWSQSPATATPNPYPSGASQSTGGDGTRSAHNGVLAAPPVDARTGVNPDDVTAFRWTAEGRDLPSLQLSGQPSL